MGIRMENSAFSAKTASKHLCTQSIPWSRTPTLACPFGLVSYRTRFAGNHWSVRQQNMVSPIGQPLTCAIKYSWHSRICFRGSQLSFGTTEFDETFVLDCCKGAPVPESAGRKVRRHGAKAAKRGISNEYVSICTGIERGGKVVAQSVNRAKPSGEGLKKVFCRYIAKDCLSLTDGLRSYHVLETLAECTAVDVNHEGCRGMFHLNTVNSLHSYIKGMYRQYRGVATKYINRYNALFSIACRNAKNLKDELLATLCKAEGNGYWHIVINWQ